MKWIIDNWSLLVVLGAIGGCCFYYVKKFASMPSEEQVKKVKEWLLYAVLEAESIYQEKTGQIKLRYVYDMFLSKFPSLAQIVSFEQFSAWVDMALEQMRHLIETNKAIAAYVKD